MWMFYIGDDVKYAASDERKFWNHVAKHYASVPNGRAEFVKLPEAKKIHLVK